MHWDQLHPRILGAMLDLSVKVLAALPSVELVSKPRMADFAKILRVVDSVLGTEGLRHYLKKLENLAADSLTGDCFIQALLERARQFEGTAAELLANSVPEKLPKTWPKDARVVTTLLKRHAPAMRIAGWTVDNDNGRNKSNVLIWTLFPPEKECKPASPPSLPNENGEDASLASQVCGPSQDEKCLHCDGEGCAWCLCSPIEPNYDGPRSEATQ